MVVFAKSFIFTPRIINNGAIMNTKTIALVISFAAVTIVLNPIGVPAPYLPGFQYRVWDIPIIVAFLLFGFKFAVSVAVFNAAAQLMLFPRPIGVVAPLWFLVAVLVLLAGLYFAAKLLKGKVTGQKTPSDRKPLIYFTALGITFRVAIMPLVDYYVGLYALPLVGVNLSPVFLLAAAPATVLFSVTQTLYLVPVGYLIAKKVNKALKVGMQSYLNA